MIRSLYCTKDGLLQTDLSVGEISSAAKDTEGLLWVDFEASPPEEDEALLTAIFRFHPLAIDDALQETHVPKLDDWGEYVYIVLHAAVLEENHSGILDTQELDVFLGANYLVTHHDFPIPALEKTFSYVQRDERYLSNGADRLLYRLVDEVVESYMPAVENLDLEIDRMEDEIFDRPTPQTLEKIFTLKRSVLRLRRVVGPLREVLNKLARDELNPVKTNTRVYFRDVYDHLVRLNDLSENIRDLISGTLDTYLSVINNRMNDIMKTLTVITTLFMPISFIVGFFGMNYFAPVANLNQWTDLPAFWVMLVITILTPVGMFAWIRRRGWM